jgi:hypothetical protein
VGLDQQRVAEITERLGVVARALRGDPQALALGVQHGGDDLVGVTRHGDGGWALVDGEVPGRAYLVVTGIAGAHDFECGESHGIHSRDRRFGARTFRRLPE